jgi:hypothetical protein
MSMSRAPGERRFSPLADNAGAESRRFFRVSVRLPVSFVVLPQDAPPPASRATTKTIDVTPGGVSFVTPERLAIGDRLDLALTLYLPTQTTVPYKIRTTAEVVRVSSHTVDDGEAFLVGVELSGITEFEQMLLARFLFDVQRHKTTH